LRGFNVPDDFWLRDILFSDIELLTGVELIVDGEFCYKIYFWFKTVINIEVIYISRPALFVW